MTIIHDTNDTYILSVGGWHSGQTFFPPKNCISIIHVYIKFLTQLPDLAFYLKFSKILLSGKKLDTKKTEPNNNLCDTNYTYIDFITIKKLSVVHVMHIVKNSNMTPGFLLKILRLLCQVRDWIQKKTEPNK